GGVLTSLPPPQIKGQQEVGVVSLKHLYEVALVKQQDPGVGLRGTPLPALVRSLVGTARSLGIRVVPRYRP
ncbi:RM11 protein, partial [Tricholaema leucomelas]|nr:RM11 protein [Tricholaema leucomelas]